ncbi:uncharacterized protein LOC106645426 [Copidosoma floridanum]|uniref:uncharacterized protein LOC106645424 n=1 Tax=Copidosoma floridanum TaxID=29053 RepID=UPI0006C9DC93|nr:uncharacterized protein LOC106645424 [Copidosoma floridanum]XP_014216771.1 uncharacterized protein LOC106645426 [Copidosoma floridanum]
MGQIKALFDAIDQESITKNMITSRITALNRVCDEARTVHADIVVREDAESDPYVASKKFTLQQSIYEGYLNKLLTVLTGLEEAERSNRPPRNDPNVSVNIDPQLGKLPNLALPSFSGKYEDWESFLGLFVSLVHEIDYISDVNKLQYLKSCLTGNAADLVKDVTLKGDNYSPMQRREL